MTLSRRSFITGAVSISTLGILSACAPPDPNGSPSSTPRPTASGGTDPSAAPPAPTDRPPYGPNGTHYPPETPALGARAATELEVDCSWAAIAAAIESLSADDVADGAAIRVRPGTLSGAGSGSRTSAVLEGLGSQRWSRNVLICPRDGYGSTTMVTDGFRINDCHRLALFGFGGPTVGFVLTNCSNFQVGWGSWSTVNVTQSGADIELYELVAGFRRDPNDTVGVRPTDTNQLTNLSLHGCVFGPSVKPDGSDAHCDTIQLEGTGTGAFGPVTSIDCIDFGSSNAAIVAHGSLSLLEFRHCLVLAEELPWQIYPLAPGDYRGTPNAFAGGAPDVRLYDSHVVGALGRLGYTHVVDTRVNYRPQETQQPTVEGAWIVDPAMSTWTGAQIMELAGTDFTPESFERFWRW